ncbi:calcium-binding protein [Phenylobacterium sp.]|uniref:calcium-binding protein n=1 Tax=Phenylobacterium sp. TaxID=1871053 RepID=UPI002F95E6DE
MADFQPQQGDWRHTLYGTNKGEWLIGYSSDDTIYANEGDDSLSGVHGTDILDGGDGADTLMGGTGTDYLTGGLGADHFRMETGGGWEIVFDYHRGQGDRIYVENGQGATAVVVSDGDTYVNLGGGDGFVLVGVTNFNSSELYFY